MTRPVRRCPLAVPPVAPYEYIPEPAALVPDDEAPDTIAGWQALADSLLTDQACAFHRNVEISSRYAWIHKSLPCLKWAAMAALASHHVRLALFPLRLDTDRTGYVDIPHSLGRRRLLLRDVHAIRGTNNAIFNDIFWVHLAYASTDNGIHRIRSLLREQPDYAPVLAGFEAIDHGREVIEDGAASAEQRRTADDVIWTGNVQLLEHEQRALVQPRFDQLSCAFARLASLGAATSFEVRGARQELACFTSFYTYSLTRGMSEVVRRRAWPRITRYDDRWHWISSSVVPQFRKFEADGHLIDASLERIFEDARGYAAIPCELPPVQR